MTRREFIKKGFARFFWGLWALFIAYPAFSFMTFRTSRKKTIVFHPEEQLSPVNFKDGAYFIKKGGEEAVFSARCSHLGCTVNFDPISNQFRCPCHGSVFDLEGNRVAGPARRPLTRVPISRKDNKDIVVTLTV